MVLLGFVDGQRQIGIDFAEKKPRPGRARQQQRVLAAPAQSAFAGEFHFQHRCAVGEDAELEWADFVLDFFRQLLQPGADQLVIVAAQRIARDVGFVAVFHDRDAVVRLGREVGHARSDHAQRARHQFLRTAALDAVVCHIIHLAMAALRQPFQQAHFGLAEIAAGDADRLKAEFHPPRLDIRGDLP